MGIRFRLLLAGLVATLLLVFAATATASAAAEVIDRIVAVVNEDIILLSELRERMAPFVQRIRSQGYDLEKERKMIFKVREEMLNRLVDEKLTDQEIERNDLQVDETQIDNTIETIKKANSFTDEDLRRFLEQEDMTMEQYRDTIREQVLRSRLVNYEVKSKIVITDEEIQNYYESHPELYGGKIRYHLRNILMIVPGNPTEEEKETVRARMEILRTRIQDGESFADLARAFSQSPTADDGGNLGEFEKETLDPRIQAALEGLKPGDVTTVLDTDAGLQIFYLEAIHRSESKPLESVKAEIQQKLFAEVVDQKFVAWLDELRSQSVIKIIN